MIGYTFAHYQVLEKLGEGGMGVVWKAKDTRLGRFVALKTLTIEGLADPARRARFVQEARAASALNHPNIVHIYDIVDVNGAQFIAMEYVTGKTLEQVIAHKGLSINVALKHGVQVADALAKAHSAGIIHRDLKPSNIMVTVDGLVKVLDFGLAKLTEGVPESDLETTSSLTIPESDPEKALVCGTVPYMSPEQVEGKKIDSRTDIFSFGAVLYEAVNGRRAFRRESQASTLAAILREEPQAYDPSVPRELQRVIARCLRKDPDRRYQNMVDLKIALEDLKQEYDSGTLEPLPRQSSVVKTGRRATLAVLAVLAVVAVLAIVLSGLRNIGSKSYAEPRLVPLTTYNGIEAFPSFSPDGNQIAFSWNGENQDNFDIYVKLVDSPSILRLTRNSASNFAPAWSPDGRSIAFIRGRGEESALMTVPAIGGPERVILEPAGWSRPAWSPDGKWLCTEPLRPRQRVPVAPTTTTSASSEPCLQRKGQVWWPAGRIQDNFTGSLVN